MAIGTKVKTIRTGEELQRFLNNHDVLSVQLSHTYYMYGYDQRAENVWVVWYKED